MSICEFWYSQGVLEPIPHRYQWTTVHLCKQTDTQTHRHTHIYSHYMLGYIPVLRYSNEQNRNFSPHRVYIMWNSDNNEINM